jgi:hypothetical protein
MEDQMINAASLEWVHAGLTGDADRLKFKDGEGHTIIELSVPSGLINAFIVDKALAEVSVNLDGTLFVEMIEDDGLGNIGIEPIITIDDLVARDTSREMLADEPDAVRQLDAFEARLKRSLALVAEARNHLGAPKQD